MESELKALNPNQTHESQLKIQMDDSSIKDDRPLLKPDPVANPASTLNMEELEKKYAPFVRHDVYGIMGWGELPWREKLLIGFSLVTLVPVRVTLAVTTLLIYYFICRICTVFSVPNREDEQEDYAHMGGWRRAVIVQTGRFLSRVMLFIFGFYFIRETYQIDEGSSCLSGKNEIEADPEDQSQKSERFGVIVCNHVSYLDILYHMSTSFPSFVAKRSVAKLPLVGHISKCLGCVCVQRESKSSDSKGVSGIVNERIKEAHQSESAPMMMLFPEGTTTNGDFLLPFKTGAFLSRTPVLPVILRYPYQRFSPAWDSISGARHVFFLLCQFANYMEVTKLPIYYPSQQEKVDPKIYAENIRRLMAHEGNLAFSDIGLSDKRVYHAALEGLHLRSASFVGSCVVHFFDGIYVQTVCSLCGHGMYLEV